MGEVAKKQFLEEFDLPKKSYYPSYPKDIDEYYKHPLRDKKVGEPITLLFAIGLLKDISLLVALEVFKQLLLKYPNVKMLMNAEGSQKSNV